MEFAKIKGRSCYFGVKILSIMSNQRLAVIQQPVSTTSESCYKPSARKKSLLNAQLYFGPRKSKRTHLNTICVHITS